MIICRFSIIKRSTARHTRIIVISTFKRLAKLHHSTRRWAGLRYIIKKKRDYYSFKKNDKLYNPGHNTKNTMANKSTSYMSIRKSITNVQLANTSDVRAIDFDCAQGIVGRVINARYYYYYYYYYYLTDRRSGDLVKTHEAKSRHALELDSDLENPQIPPHPPSRIKLQL